MGVAVYEPFFAYHVSYHSDVKRGTILEDWRDHLSNLETRGLLTMPDLNLFDDHFRTTIDATLK